MALALTYKAILENFRIPDGVVVFYPALNLNKYEFTRSRLLAFDEKLLSHTFLQMCLDCYIQNTNDKPESDLFLSPIKVGQEIMLKLPKIRMISGDNDPLYDDCLVFTEKLVESGVDVKFSVFRGFPHGAISFYKPKGVKESKFFYQKSLEYFREIFQSS